MFLAPLPAALLSNVITISTLVSDNSELTRDRVNYEAKGKKLETGSGFPQYFLYLWHNFQCKFTPQPIGSALLALPPTERQVSKLPAVYCHFYSTHSYASSRDLTSESMLNSNVTRARFYSIL